MAVFKATTIQEIDQASMPELVISDLIWTLGVCAKRLEAHVRKDHPGLVDAQVLDNVRTALVNGQAALHLISRTPTLDIIEQEITTQQELVNLVRALADAEVDDRVVLGSYSGRVADLLDKIEERSAS